MNADELAGDHRLSPEAGPFVLTVDGEVFTVTLGPGRRCDYAWDSGPNKGYGFSSTTFVAGDPAAVPPLLTIDQHRESIRDFLGSINPEAGYLD